MNIAKTLFFRNLKEWNMLDFDIRSSESLNVTENQVLKFIRPKPNSFFNCHNPKGVKLTVRLRLALIHLLDHKFKYNFQDCLNPIFNCGIEVETTIHYLFHCHDYLPERKTLFDDVKSGLSNIPEQNKSFISNVLLFGDNSVDDSANTIVLSMTINYIISTKRFDDSIFTF